MKDMIPDDPGPITSASVENEIQKVNEVIESVREMGANVDAAESIVSQAKRALSDGNVETAQTLLESAMETSKLIKQQYFIQASSILFSSLQRKILNLEGAGSEVSYIKDLYNKAKEMFDDGHYDEAMDYIKSAEDLAHDLKAGLPTGTILDEVSGEVVTKTDTELEIDQSQEQMERVSKTLIQVEKLLQEAIDAGYFVNEAEKLYSLAEDAFDYQDYKKAEDYALESQNSLEDILKPFYEDQQRKLMGTGEGENDESMDKKSLPDYRENLPLGDSFSTGGTKFSDVMPMGIIGDAPKGDEEEQAPPVTEEKVIDEELEVEKEATNLLITADEKITAAKEIGLNIPMAERLLTIGESYFDRGEFDKVTEYASKAIKQVDDIISRKGYEEILKEKLEEDKTLIAEEDKFEVPMPIVEPETEIIEPMAEPVEVRAISAKKRTKKGKKSETAIKLEAALHKIEVEIMETKDLGVDIEDTEESIHEALEALELGNLAEAKGIGIAAKNKIKKIKKGFIKKKALELIKVAWKEIEIAETNGVEVSDPNIELKDARNLIKDGDYEKAAKLAMNVIQLLKRD